MTHLKSPHTNITADESKRLVDYLILNSSFTPDLGLFHGKLGIVLFFSLYARRYNNPTLDDFAGELLEEIYEDIHTEIPINLESGLCGIGWGIEYLVQHGLMEGDTDDILEDIDLRIMKTDPRRMTDYSFRTGLAGILYYVTARLNSPRTAGKQPFDLLYLSELSNSVRQVDFGKEKDLPPQLIDNFRNALSGTLTTKLRLPELFYTSALPIPLPDHLSMVSLGLENGLLILLEKKNECALMEKKERPLSSQKTKNLFIFNEESRAGNYGIGTYIEQLTGALRDNEWQITVVMLRSSQTETLTVEHRAGIAYITVASPKAGDQWNNKRYYRNVLILLYPYLNSGNAKYLFHLNQMHQADLALGLKSYFPAGKVVGTVHYMDWSFALLGDKQKLKELLSAPDSEKGKPYADQIAEEKRFLDASDNVVAIARHSYNTLQEIYKVTQSKLTLIPNGLKDAYRSLTDEEREALRAKYGFRKDDLILIFAGRVDQGKGVDLLAEVFSLLASHYPNLRLIIAGDGNLSPIQEKVKPHWSRITLTGYVDKSTLFELYAIADIGVLPSLYEGCPYSTMELMMMGLPLVVPDTLGQNEMVIDEKTGIVVSFSDESEKISRLKRAIEILLSSPYNRKRFGNNGRVRFLEYYEVSVFGRNVKTLYKALLVD